MLNVRNGGYTGYFPLEPTPPNTRQGPYPHYDPIPDVYTVNTPYYGRFDRTRNVTAATLTRYADRFAGKAHEFKFGAEFERSKIRNESGYPGGRYYYDYGGEPYTVTLWEGYVTNAVAKRTSLYVQDTWTVTDRLTLNPGIRIDVNRGSVPSGTVLSNHALVGRIGAAFDVLGDHHNVLRVHYGRYADALFGGQFEFMDLSQQHPKITAEVLGPNRFVEINRQSPATNLGIDPNITQSYHDQFLLGFERELFANFSTTVQYVRRSFRNFMGFVDTGTVYRQASRPDPGPDGRVGTSDDGAALTVFENTNPGHEFKLFTNPDNAFRDYDGFQIIGTKRYSQNWQATVSYTRSHARGTVDNRSATNSGGGGTQGLGQTGGFANPNHSININGDMRFDPTNVLKLEGTYRVPYFGGFNLSTVYRYSTGLAWGRIATIRNLPQGSESVRVEPIGTRRAPAVNYIDVRAEKTFPLGAAGRTAGIVLDIFNLNNQGVNDNGARDAVIESSGANFGNPNRWVSPRLARLGFRVTW